ncbi:MAG: hypothetical protein ACPHLK_03320 [Gammaproteobacteria bacterium]|jgi:hypothetical protein
MTKMNEDELNSNIKQSLDDSIDALDANTLSDIRQVRAKAIEKASLNHSVWAGNKQGFLIGGVTTACVMVLAVVLLFNSPTSVQSIPAEDIELISSSDSFELYEELEFYEWLEEDGLPS